MSRAFVSAFLLSVAITMIPTNAAFAQSKLIVAQAESRPLGPRAQAMLDALMVVMGVSGQTAQQQIIGVLIGYRAGDVAPADAIRQLNQLAVNGFWGTETVNEIVARVRVAQALTGDWNGDGRFNRVQAVAYLLAASDPTRQDAFSDAEIGALLAEIDRGDIDVAGAIGRLSRFDTGPQGIELFAFHNAQDPSPFVEEILAQGVVDALAGASGTGGVSIAEVDQAVRSMALSAGIVDAEIRGDKAR